jgi:hypothetical protein
MVSGHWWSVVSGRWFSVVSGQPCGSFPFPSKPAHVLVGVLIGPEFLAGASQGEQGVILLSRRLQAITQLLQRMADLRGSASSYAGERKRKYPCSEIIFEIFVKSVIRLLFAAELETNYLVQYALVNEHHNLWTMGLNQFENPRQSVPIFLEGWLFTKGPLYFHNVRQPVPIVKELIIFEPARGPQEIVLLQAAPEIRSVPTLEVVTRLYTGRCRSLRHEES